MEPINEVVVTEVQDPTVTQDTAELIVTDARSHDGTSHTGYIEMRLTNGRVLHIGGYGIWDGEDRADVPGGDWVDAAYINWEELLQHLDAWRAMHRLGKAN